MKKYDVITIYSPTATDKFTIRQELTQQELVKVLSNENITLVSVNDSGRIYHRRKRRKG